MSEQLAKEIVENLIGASVMHYGHREVATEVVTGTLSRRAASLPEDVAELLQRTKRAISEATQEHGAFSVQSVTELYTALETQSRYLHWLTMPRAYDGETEPVVCPYCNGAIDDHRADCKIEAAQTLSLFQQLESLSQERAVLAEGLKATFVIDRTQVDWGKINAAAALIEGEKGEGLMSTGIVICSKCKHEVHQIGWLETEDGREHNWQHCDKRSPICKGAIAEYPKTTGDIVGSWCGMDDI